MTIGTKILGYVVVFMLGMVFSFITWREFDGSSFFEFISEFEKKRNGTVASCLHAVEVIYCWFITLLLPLLVTARNYFPPSWYAIRARRRRKIR